MAEENYKEIEAQCYFCPNECRLLLAIDKNQIVRSVKRNTPKSRYGTTAPIKEKQCSRLEKLNLKGQHLEKVLAILRSPRVPKIIVGGHWSK